MVLANSTLLLPLVCFVQMHRLARILTPFLHPQPPIRPSHQHQPQLRAQARSEAHCMLVCMGSTSKDLPSRCALCDSWVWAACMCVWFVCLSCVCVCFVWFVSMSVCLCGSWVWAACVCVLCVVPEFELHVFVCVRVCALCGLWVWAACVCVRIWACVCHASYQRWSSEAPKGGVLEMWIEYWSPSWLQSSLWLRGSYW
jgi:hypothetical protein